jgi:tetraacyldisaccharide 4'-kinase
VSIDSTLQRIWYERGPVQRIASYLLSPLALLFAAVSLTRRALYRVGIFKSRRVSRPVIVVGNVTVGGTGKTPFVIWLARHLQTRGVRVAIVTRGYGGNAQNWPQDVTADSDANVVGDEAVVLAMGSNAIVVAGPDRVADAQRAIERGAEIIICDDGLQHYRLQRDAEIVLFDAERGAGNGMYLPAGPLREGMRRLRRVQLVIEHLRSKKPAVRKLGVEALLVSSKLGKARSLASTEQRPLAAFAGQPVHAIAGIGNPEAFFTALRGMGLLADARALPDHARLSSADLAFNDNWPVLMTEKDAVKCRAFADARCWSVELAMSIDDAQSRVIMQIVDSAMRAHKVN